MLELACEEGELERLGHAPEHRPSLLGEGDRGLEELLHLESGSDLDADERCVRAGVGEVVRYAGRDDDDLFGTCNDALTADPENASSL